MTHVWYCDTCDSWDGFYRPSLVDSNDILDIANDDEEAEEGYGNCLCDTCSQLARWVPAPPEEPSDDDVMAELDELAGASAPSYGYYMSIADPIAFSIVKRESWDRMKADYEEETGISL